MCEISTKEKDFPSSKDPLEDLTFFIVAYGQGICMKAQRLFCIAFVRRTLVERKRFPFFQRFLAPFLFLKIMSKDPKF